MGATLLMVLFQLIPLTVRVPARKTGKGARSPRRSPPNCHRRTRRGLRPAFLCRCYCYHRAAHGVKARRWEWRGAMPGGKGLGAAGQPHANATQRGVGASTRMRRRAEEDAEMPEWSDDTNDPNDTQWARLDPTRGMPFDAAADWAEQPTQPQPAIRPHERYH